MRTRVALAAVVLCALLSSCHKWVPLQMPIEQAIREEDSGALRVTLADSSRVVLEGPKVSGDSLIGSGDGVAVALTDVRQVEARRTDGLATAGLVTGIAVGGFFGLLYAACYLGGCEWRR